jgi:hypothetical protein
MERVLAHPPDPILGVTDDLVIQLLLSGEAKTLYEAKDRENPRPAQHCPALGVGNSTSSLFSRP